MHFEIAWVSLIVGSKLKVFALFYFVFESNFQVQALGGLILGGAIERRVFCVTGLGALIFGGAYFRNFTVSKISEHRELPTCSQDPDLLKF